MDLQTPRSKVKASYPASLHLIAYGLAIALPLIGILGILLFQTASYEQERSRDQILRVLGRITDSLDRDLDRHLTILQTLATSPALKSRNCPVFYEQAKAALQGRSYAVVSDTSRRQVVNTYVPYGEQPTLTGDPETLRRMIETKRPVFSNLFTSLVVKKPVVNISIPVLDRGELRYVLSLGLLPEDLASLLDGEKLDPHWVSLILDTHNVVLAHSRAKEQSVGETLAPEMHPQDGQPTGIRTLNFDGEDVLYATTRSRLSGWGVGVNVPVKFLERQSHIPIWLAVAALVAIVFAVGLGIVFAHELTRPLAVASKAALALGRHEAIGLMQSRLTEANTFNNALKSAESELAQRRSAEQIMIRELQHRTNNLLAVVQSVAHSSLSGTRSLEEAKASFEARLQALARIHRELTSTNWSGVSLDKIVLMTLRPYSARINVAGTTVNLTAKDSQNMSLVLHELATNAVKYGALSNSHGRIRVSWTADKEVVNFKWQEAGGPPVVLPTRRGFGSSLLRAIFRDIKLDYLPTGLTCEFQFCLSAEPSLSSAGIMASGEAGQG